MAGDGLYRCPAMRALPDPADYDDDRPRVEDALDEVLPGQNLATRWVDVDPCEPHGELEGRPTGLHRLRISELATGHFDYRADADRQQSAAAEVGLREMVMSTRLP